MFWGDMAITCGRPPGAPALWLSASAQANMSNDGGEHRGPHECTMNLSSHVGMLPIGSAAIRRVERVDAGLVPNAGSELITRYVDFTESAASGRMLPCWG